MPTNASVQARNGTERGTPAGRIAATMADARTQTVVADTAIPRISSKLPGT